jgi:8-oxo-dGTP pyrophosphatase MutT (NUDIX family)
MEIWDAFLPDGTLAGCDLVRGEPIPNGLYHLVCEILVRHTDGEYLLMQRDPRKPNYGGYFEATAGGSALKGEDAFCCAKRELREETGIDAGTLTNIGRFLSHNTIYETFLCVTDCDKSSITLQEGETVSYKWITEAEFIDFVNSGAMIDVQFRRHEPYLRQMGYIQ